MPVYTVRPGGTATSLVHSHWSAASASGPVTKYFEKDVWSKTATRCRVASCSADDQGCQFCLSQEYSITAGRPAGAKKLARSQPILAPKQAFASASSW